MVITLTSKEIAQAIINDLHTRGVIPPDITYEVLFRGEPESGKYWAEVTELNEPAKIRKDI